MKILALPILLLLPGLAMSDPASCRMLEIVKDNPHVAQSSKEAFAKDCNSVPQTITVQQTRTAPRQFKAPPCERNPNIPDPANDSYLIHCKEQQRLKHWRKRISDERHSLVGIPTHTITHVRNWLRSCQKFRVNVQASEDKGILWASSHDLEKGRVGVRRAYAEHEPLKNLYSEETNACAASEEYRATAEYLAHKQEKLVADAKLRRDEQSKIRSGVESRAISDGYEGVYWKGLSDYLSAVRSGSATLDGAGDLVFPLKGSDREYVISQILPDVVVYSAPSAPTLFLPRSEGKSYLEGNAITNHSSRAYFAFRGTTSYTTVLGATAQALVLEPVF